ncbi:peptidase M6 [Nocardioides sp. HDW12B]|uniref:immune inhibitor A domain-containing protein n=1 Tax=Nocardioides sp. HDW12B TaxID=2714939 RepID=UPI001409FE6B|nr:immune inhibitor A domain-containing protein [Nocardioides sp. HDW12B]QIK65702.1 peptidase M6 [Nocardioides sp. HDW12B]
MRRPSRTASRRPTLWTAALTGSAVAIALGLPTLPAGAAPAPAPDPSGPASAAPSGTDDTREFVPSAKTPRLDRGESVTARRQARADATGAPQVGDTRSWLANDDIYGPYLKRYVLRGMGDNVQVWVANDRAFPTDDCRNDLGLTEITKKQVSSFVDEFSTTMYPRESKVFSVPPDRNGADSSAAALGLDADYWKVPRKQADDIVVLVDNVRDGNYYAPATPDGQTFIAGFFWSYFNELADRNIMTIDAYDWIHRTGVNPPDNSTEADYEACAEELDQPTTNFGISRPQDYEGTFAHEYQHLLEYYEDEDEVNWVNEGVSDWAQTLTGYTDPRVNVSADGADRHMACFAGYLGRRFGGPENSMTLWGEQGGPEILCDYGAAYSFMEYLHSLYGNAIMTKLHRLDANGLRGLQRALDAVGARGDAMTHLHRWAVMVAIDRPIDRDGGRLTGGNPDAFTADSLSFHVKWANPESYGDAGAPANGADYVRLRNDGGDWLAADEISSLRFNGSDTALGEPVEWAVDSTPPATADGEDDTCATPPADGSGAPALYSGCGDNLDRSIARTVSVPEGDPTLSFDSLSDIEEAWDFGIVQVSEDDGQTWTTVPTTDSTSEHDPDADPAIVAQLPGLTGSSDGYRTQTADLSDWAGEDVLLAFRYMTDGAQAEAGWWVRNIDVGGTAIPATLDGWRTQTQIDPDPVADWTVQLVAYGAAGDPVRYHRMALDPSHSGVLSGDALRQAIGDDATTVAAIVMQDDPREVARYQAGYQLVADGTLQPGGGIPGCFPGARCR